ncbi:MAG: chorismate mutase, partial [Deltaproteobacteria bacterium]|jgi:chorismate mutase/prephenate dehydratase
MDRLAPKNLAGDTNTEINALRSSIDAIDDEIMRLINRRLLLAAQIGAVKKHAGIQVEDNRREENIMRRLGDENKGPLNEGGMRAIFKAIIAECRHIQHSKNGRR